MKYIASSTPTLLRFVLGFLGRSPEQRKRTFDESVQVEGCSCNPGITGWWGIRAALSLKRARVGDWFLPTPPAWSRCLSHGRITVPTTANCFDEVSITAALHDLPANPTHVDINAAIEQTNLVAEHIA